MPVSDPFHRLTFSDFLVIREDSDEAMDEEALMESARKIEQRFQGRANRILVDARGTEKSYSFADAYRVVQVFKKAPGHRSGQLAIVGDYRHQFEKAQALEYFYQEAGVDVRAFLDYDEAVAWLKSLRS